MKVAQEPVSLETPIGEEEDSHLAISSRTRTPRRRQTPHPSRCSRNSSRTLDTLAEREAKVLRLRFGIDDGRARTLEEVGQEFGVTRERIRQIEAKALRKLRHPNRSKKLKDFLE